MITLSSLTNPTSLAAETASIELFNIAPEILTRSTIRPDKIETFSEVEKRTLTDPADREAFFAALAASKPALGRQISECRIKAVFVDASGARLGEIYASAISPYGMIGTETWLTFGTKALSTFVQQAVATSVKH